MHQLKWIPLLLMIVTVRGTVSKDSSHSEDPKATLVEPASSKDQEVIDRLEKSLLALFGMEEKPQINGNVRVPPYMYNLYKTQERLNRKLSDYPEEKTENYAQEQHPGEGIWGNTVRSFTHTESADDAFHPSHKMVLRFHTKGIPDKEKLRYAELRLFHAIHPSAPRDFNHETKKRKRLPKRDGEHLQWVMVYDIIRPARGSKGEIHKLMDSRVIDARTNGTISLDVSTALKRWFTKPRTKYGLYIEVLPIKRKTVTPYNNATHVRLRRSPVVQPDSDQWVEEQPLLVIHTDDESIKPREKRSAPAKGSSKRPLCRRHRLFVDFRKVEWNTWIVAPPGYDAFYCQGECPYPLSNHMNATNHAVIQNIIHSRYPSRVPSACCVPIKHSAISMLYLDTDKKVVLKTYQDMIVESCGCQ